MQTITHHGVGFTIDVMDWSDEKASHVASDELIAGLMKLSPDDVQRIAKAWSDADAECDSRNANDDVAQTVEAIESAAYLKAIEGWVSTPDGGHNCSISIVR